MHSYYAEEGTPFDPVTFCYCAFTALFKSIQQSLEHTVQRQEFQSFHVCLGSIFRFTGPRSRYEVLRAETDKSFLPRNWTNIRLPPAHHPRLSRCLCSLPNSVQSSGSDSKDEWGFQKQRRKRNWENRTQHLEFASEPRKQIPGCLLPAGFACWNRLILYCFFFFS